jgi:hypothetical protein
LNLGAGYYDYHTLYEYVVAEEKDRAVAIGMYLINRFGLKEHVIPFLSRNRLPDNPDYVFSRKSSKFYCDKEKTEIVLLMTNDLITFASQTFIS